MKHLSFLMLLQLGCSSAPLIDPCGGCSEGCKDPQLLNPKVVDSIPRTRIPKGYFTTQGSGLYFHPAGQLNLNQGKSIFDGDFSVVTVSPDSSFVGILIKKPILNGLDSENELLLLDRSGKVRGRISPVQLEMNQGHGADYWRQHVFQWARDSSKILLVKDIAGKNPRSQKWSVSEIYYFDMKSNQVSSKISTFNGKFLSFTPDSNVIIFSRVMENRPAIFFRVSFATRTEERLSSAPSLPSAVFHTFSRLEFSDSSSASTYDGSTIFGVDSPSEKLGLYIYRKSYTHLFDLAAGCGSKGAPSLFSSDPYFLPDNTTVVMSRIGGNPENSQTISLLDVSTKTFYHARNFTEFYFSINTDNVKHYDLNDFGVFPERRLFP